MVLTVCASVLCWLQGFLYVRTCKSDNEYAHPLDMCPLVDLNLGKVIHVDMYDEPARMPPMMVNYHRDLAKATTGTCTPHQLCDRRSKCRILGVGGRVAS